MNTNYFSHDSNARNDSKLLRLRMKHGAAGYGIYFMLLERLREEDGYVAPCEYDVIAYELHEDAELVRSVVEDFELFSFTENGKGFYSESFNRRMGYKDEMSRARAEAGRKGGITSRKQTVSKPEANDKQTVSKPEANDKQVKESKESKEKKEKKEKTTVSSNTCACARETAVADDDISEEKNLDKELHMLVANKTWRDAVCVQHHIRSDDEYFSLIKNFRQECVCNGKMRHNGLQDLRSHFNSWLRIRLATNATTSKRAVEDKPYVMNIPTAAEEAEAEAAKAEKERQRVLGIYEGAQRGEKRQRTIVEEWAKNGVLAQYGLEPLAQED